MMEDDPFMASSDRDSLKGGLYPLGGWEPREFSWKLLGQKNPDSCGRRILFCHKNPDSSGRVISPPPLYPNRARARAQGRVRGEGGQRCQL